MEMTFKLKDGMLVAEVDESTAKEFGVVDGRRLVVVKTGNGFELQDADFVEQMSAARKIMEEDRDVLAKLAQ